MISGAPCSLCIRRRPATKRGNYTKWHIQPGTWGCVQVQGYRHTAQCYDYMSTMHLNASISWSVEKPLWQRKRKGGHTQGSPPWPPYQLKPPIPTNFFGPLKRIVFQYIRQTYHDDCQHFWPYFWPFERSLIAFKPISIAWLSIDILLSYCSGSLTL